MGKLARKVISSLNRIHIDAVIPGDFDVDESFFTFLADQEDSGNEEAEDELIDSLLSHTEVFNASFDPTFPLSDAFIGLNAEYPGIQWPYAGEDLLTLIENKLALYCGTEKKDQPKEVRRRVEEEIHHFHLLEDQKEAAYINTAVLITDKVNYPDLKRSELPASTTTASSTICVSEVLHNVHRRKVRAIPSLPFFITVICVLHYAHTSPSLCL
jgi:hypothetical protein